MLKKCFLLGIIGLAGLSISCSYAGGNSPMGSAYLPSEPATPAIPPEASDNGTFINANVGYVKSNWKSYYPTVTFSSNDSGGFIYGGDVGYQWSHYLAAEFGFYIPPTVRYTSGGGGRLKTWFVYGSVEFLIPVPWLENLQAFFKAGMSYRHLSVTGITPTVAGFRPLFAAGGQYNFTENWSVNIQWMHVANGRNILFGGSAINTEPAYDLFTIGAGYKFTF